MNSEEILFITKEVCGKILNWRYKKIIKEIIILFSKNFILIFSLVTNEAMYKNKIRTPPIITIKRIYENHEEFEQKNTVRARFRVIKISEIPIGIGWVKNKIDEEMRISKKILISLKWRIKAKPMTVYKTIVFKLSILSNIFYLEYQFWRLMGEYSYFENMEFIFYIILLGGTLRFISQRKHILISLIRLEFLVISFFLGFNLTIILRIYDIFILLYYLTYTACEGALGLGILIRMVRGYGNDLFSRMGITQC